MAKTPKLLDRISALLQEESTLALATADGQGEPCVAPLFYIADEDLSLYWLSAETSRHSENLKRSPRAAVTVYCSAETWKDIRGVQMHGSVSVITEQPRRRNLIQAYCRRFQLSAIFRLPISQSGLYMFRPDFIRYIDNSERFGTKSEMQRDELGHWCGRPLAAGQTPSPVE